MNIPRLQDWAPDPNTSYPVAMMPLEVQQMATATDEILKRWQSIYSHSRNSKPIPETLYHYTDINGAHGIVFERNELWLTDFRATNDPTEGRHAKMLLEKRILTDLPAVAAAALEHFFHAPPGEGFDELYIIADSLHRRFFSSFSEMPDDLSQWVHYGDGGRGYCIGVSTEFLLKQKVIAGTSTIEPQLIPVEYDLEKQDETIKAFLADIASCHDIHEPMLRSHPIAVHVMYEFFANLLRWFSNTYALVFKNPHFASEKEWRCVIDVPITHAFDAPAKTRVKGTSIAWYMPVQCSVKSIRVGPKVNFEQFRSAFSPLRFTGLNGANLLKSDIPLR